MTIGNWNENGKTWDEDQTLLDDSELAQLTRADGSDLNGRMHSPIPTQMVSNGEYMPAPQTEKQKRVEARIDELSTFASPKLGLEMLMEFPGFTADNMSQFKEKYAASGGERSNTRYGWVKA